MTVIGRPVAAEPAGPSRRPRLTFIGTGYLGATSAICFAELGYDVMGVDVDAKKVERLSRGEVPFYEPGLDEVLRRALDAGRLTFTTDVRHAAAFGDVHFICVGTPQGDEGSTDLRFVEAVVTELVPHIRHPALLVGKSTVPAGTAAWVRTLVDDLAQPGVPVDVAWSPEFLREGQAVADVLRPGRVVFGTSSDWATSMLTAAHQGIVELAAREGRAMPVVVTDEATAELVKVASNAFLATKLSFINAMAVMCDAVGADVSTLSHAMGLDDRIGAGFLGAGLGFGGGCLPKDVRALAARAEQFGVTELRFLAEVDAVNRRTRSRVVELVAAVLGRSGNPQALPGLGGCRVAVLGATFKPDTDDVRDSPALTIARQLRGCGADVHVYDPEGMDNARAVAPELTYWKTMDEAVTGADVVCVLTAWAEFREADPAALAGRVRRRILIDGMNCLAAPRWTAVGWTFRAPGRPGSDPITS